MKYDHTVENAQNIFIFFIDIKLRIFKTMGK